MYPALTTATATATAAPTASATPSAADPAAFGPGPPPLATPQPAVLSPARPKPAPELIEFVDFKWLMAGEGHRIDLGRLQAEAAYACGCLALASGSTSATLRRAAARLAQSLGLDAARVRPGPETPRA